MSLDDLNDLGERERARQAKLEKRVLWCSAAGCVSCGGHKTRDALKKAVRDQGLEGRTEVVGTGCMGLCGRGPLVKVAPDETLYANVDEAVATRIVTEHVAKGEVVVIDENFAIRVTEIVTQKKPS